MTPDNGEARNNESKSKSISLDELLEQRKHLDELFEKKFTRVITAMFTDMKGSTTFGDIFGDIAIRMLIKNHNDIVFPIIAENKGVLVKTMGDGTLSYFENPTDAVRAAVKIQASIDEYNRIKKSKTPILVRIGMHTGTGIVEKNDIFGDVVNVASRFESLAEPTEIYISEETHNSLRDKDEFYCRSIKTTTLKGKEGLFKVFKVFWKKEEIEQDKSAGERAQKEVSAGETVSLESFRKDMPPPSAGVKPASEETILLQKANDLEKNNEIIELFLFSEAFNKLPEIGAIYQDLKNKLKASGKIETNLNGKNALWFFKETITIGRLPEADFRITNQAISRVMIKVGIKNREGILKIEGAEKGKIKPIEIEMQNRRKPVEPDIEYALGNQGKIILSVCFPLEYSIYKDRFLTFEILNPGDCIKKHFNFGLMDVWPNFKHESEKIVIIGC